MDSMSFAKSVALSIFALLHATDAWTATSLVFRKQPPHGSSMTTVVHSAVSTSSVVSWSDEDTATSSFGLKSTWDDQYAGRGDFPAEEYSWYYGWEVAGRYIREFTTSNSKILLPGIGNDPLLLDMWKAGYTKLTAQDYSEYAVERQRDLLSFEGNDALDQVILVHGDVRNLPEEWTASFDAVVEKGLLDAVYLSGDGNLELAVDSLERCLRPGGRLLSFSGVVPVELRQHVFRHGWQWLRDGSNDLQAGCFILEKES